jgi:hypothetical protein
MGVRGQHGVAFGFGAIGQHPHQPGECLENLRATLPDVQSQIERDLIVPGTRGVEDAGWLAEPSGQLRLHGHVHVLFLGKGEGALLHLVPQCQQSGADLLGGRAGDDPPPRQHGEMSQAPEEIFPEQRAVQR